MKKTILIMFGGKSGEYDVSLVSASAVLEHISRDRYDIITVGVSRDGRWFLYEGDTELISDNRWIDDREKLTPCAVCPDYGTGTLTVFGDTLRKIKFDAVFPVMHGTQGEDGSLQGLFELCGAPVVGCTSETSSICMDKDMTKRVLERSGISTAHGVTLSYCEFRRGGCADRVEGELEYPVFVKPSRAGSSVGISMAHNRAELEASLEEAFLWDSKVLCERCICGREIECAVLTDSEGNITVSRPGEIDPGDGFYDYETKYVNDNASYYIPARLDGDTEEKVRECAKRAAEAVGVCGLSRIDFFVCDDNEIILNEINTMPGFTPISMYPKLMIHSGISYSELIDRLITEALDRHRTAIK